MLIDQCSFAYISVQQVKHFLAYNQVQSSPRFYISRVVADIYRLTLQECLKFLKEVQAVGPHNLSDQSFHLSVGVLNFFTDTTAIFLKVLLGSVGFYSYGGFIKFHFYLDLTLSKYRFSSLILTWLPLDYFPRSWRVCIYLL